MRRKNPARKSAKKSGGSKIKIRERSVLPKAGPKNSVQRAKNATAIAKRYGECSEVLVFFFPRKKRQENSTDIGHIKLLHIKLFRSPRSAVLPAGYPDKKIYVPWVPRIAHKTLTPGLPVGRPPGHRRGHRPKRFMSMCLFLSWPSVLKIVRRANSLQRAKKTTAIAKCYGECSEELVFPRKKRQENSMDSKNYGGTKILRIRALHSFFSTEVIL